MAGIQCFHFHHHHWLFLMAKNNKTIEEFDNDNLKLMMS